MDRNLFDPNSFKHLNAIPIQTAGLLVEAEILDS